MLLSLYMSRSELVSKDIKLKDAKQSTSKEPMFTSKTKEGDAKKSQ